MGRSIFTLVGLQGGWWACAWGAATGRPWLGPAVVIVYLVLYLLSAQDGREEVRYLLIVLAIGLIVDSAKRASGIVHYTSPMPPVPWIAPVWILGMWALFATALRGPLRWLGDRPWVAGLLGAVFGPLSYLTGARIGAVSFSLDTMLTMVILAAVWSWVVPLLAWLVRPGVLRN